MPLYEFRCENCQHAFEALVRSGNEARCPKCESDNLARLLSVFAVNANGAGESPVGACGSCGDPRGPGACRMN